MRKKSKSNEELEQRINCLEQQLVDKKITEHTNKYIHIPFSWGGIGRFLLVLITGALSYLNFLLLLNIGDKFKVWELLSANMDAIKNVYVGWDQLIIMYPMVGEAILIALTVVCIKALFCSTFNDIVNWESLSCGLIVGLIVGLIGVLIVGLAGGLIVGLIGGLIVGLIGGLIIGLIFGLIFGLIGGLIIGLID